MTTADQATGSYRELRRIMIAEGLLRKQRRFYVRQFIIALAYTGAGLAMIVVLGDSWWLLLTAVLWSVGGMQWAFLGHDGAHRQIASSPRMNDWLTIGGATLFTGFSLSWWMDSHNRHHAFPNHETMDPNADVAPFAFSRDQLHSKTGVMKVLTRFQGILWIPLQSLGVFDKQVGSALFITRQKTRHPFLERLSTAVHFIAYFAILFVFLSPLVVVGFWFFHWAIYGLFLGSTIAPNHKGMPTLKGDGPLDFLWTQITTARNVRPGLFADGWYGGLNYQIEHHLFPTMPRNRLGDARKIVRPYCEAHGIPYEETGSFESYWDITRFLWSVTADGAGPGDGGRTVEAKASAGS